MTTHARAHDEIVGRSLGEFVVRERIGEGGFGAVYRAIQPALDREAVIKVLHKRLSTSKTATERFLREAKLASKLDHPYAAHIYAFGAEPNGELWIAMELVRGTPLDQVLKLQGAMPIERLVPLLDRVCEVVHTAHEQGIVHRDIKPANVMVLSRAGRLLPKLLDFGIAKGLVGSEDAIASGATLRVEDSADTGADVGSAQTMDTPVGGLTQRGAIMGSPPYMAPEQWLDAGTVDARTDLYALGILAFECLTGKPPFVGTTITAFATAHGHEPVPSLGPRFAPALDRVFAKVLAKDAGERYPDALTFAAAFRAAAGIATESASLPAIDPALRDIAVNGAPQPIAEAIAAFEAARNGHQARDAIVLVARTIARYVGLLALACRSRVSSDDGASESIRMLSRRPLTDLEWIDLARQITRGWLRGRDAFPIPELVGALHDGELAEQLELLASLRDVESGSDGALGALLEAAVVRVNHVLLGLAFLRDYSLVVTVAGGYAERWMGVRRAQRSTVAVRGTRLPAGLPALLDKDGTPVLSLAPLFQVAAPTPGAPLDLFLFDGRGRRGAKLVALPSGFEHHDESLWDWFRAQLSGSLDEDEASVAEEKPPYRGLSAFSADDGAMFFGREKLVDAFVNRLKASPLLAVVGRSGAGKSSFVHAGVIPALPAGWRTIVMRPGPSPVGALIARLEHADIEAAAEWTTGETRVSGRLPAIENLRDVLARDRDALGHLLRADAARRGPILLVIDQLEELFTLCEDADERRIFAEAIANAARDVDDPVRVIFTLRDDFLVRSEQIAALRNRIGQGLQILTVPSADDLLRIVSEPARRVGYELEGDLAAEMVKEVADQAGALALLSFAANKLWELRDRHFKRLTRAAYKTLGGVGGALARHAELTLDAMLPEERGLTREAFRHLVTTQNTRAVLSRGELRQLLGSNDHADGVIEKLVAARLLVTSENETGAETIEVVHEALLVAWPRLVEWRREDSEGARFREQLRAAAKQWDERGRPKGLLWRGDALADYTRWRARQPGPLTDLEAAFAGASNADVARGRRKLRLVLAGAFAILTAGLIGLGVLNARVNVQAGVLHDHLERTYEDQGRRYVLADDPLRALAWLAKAAELGATGRNHDFLVAQAVQATDGELLEVRADAPLTFARFSHDGARLATASGDRTARVWDARSGALLATLHHKDEVHQVRFAPDDRTVLTASSDGTAALWDATSGAQLHHFDHKGFVWCATYSPDGKLALSTGDDDTAALWTVPGGELVARVHGDGAGNFACSFAPDGRSFAVGDAAGTTRIWGVDGAPRQVLRGHKRMVSDVVYAPDSARLLASSLDGTAIVWDVATGMQLHALAHTDAIRAAAFSSDGARIVTASTDHTAAVWDAATGERQLTLTGHTAGVVSAVFSPDGTRIVTAAEDASARLWDATTGRALARWRGQEGKLWDVAFDPSGTRVVTASDDKTAVVWRAVPQEHVTSLVGHDGAVAGADFSADGRHVVTSGDDGTARTWDVATGRQLALLRGHQGAVNSAAYSPDGLSIATFGDDGTVRLWDASSGIARATWSTGSSHAFGVIAWSPDGASIVVASDDGALRCWTAAGVLRFENRGHNGSQIYTANFDPSSTRILSTGADQTTRVWALDGTPIRAYPDRDSPLSAAYDPTATRVLGAVSQDKVKIWSVATGEVEVELHDQVKITDATWSPDGALALTNAADNTARIWDASTGDLLAILPHSGKVFVARFAPDGTRIVLAGPRGAAIYELPRTTGTPADFARVLRCRVPYQLEGDRLQPRVRARAGCDAP